MLKVEQKKFFRTFFSCGSCEGRQTDWTIRLTPDGVQDLGETSLVPELEAVDELFYRVIRSEGATDVASEAAIAAAEEIVKAAREEQSPEEWREFPMLGMLFAWKAREEEDHKILCLSLDESGTNLYTLRFVGGKWFVEDIQPTEVSCEK